MRRGVEEALESFCERSGLQRALDLLSASHTLSPSSLYISLFAACSKSRSYGIIRLLHVHLFLSGTSIPAAVGQHLVVALAKCGAVDDAIHVSCTLSHRTVVSWTAIISAFANSGDGAKALKIYDRMREDGIEPNQFTFTKLFQACGAIPDLLRGRALHADARHRGFVQDVFMASTLICMYSSCGSIAEAEDVFDASNVYDIVTWNSMISAYVEHGETSKALQHYLMMEDCGVCPNDRTYVSTLQACAMVAEGQQVHNLPGVAFEVASWEFGQFLHANAEKKGFTHNTYVGNCLLSMYGKCGAVEEARHVFITLPERTIVSCNSMLSTYVSQGQSIEALAIYLSMVSQNVVLDHLTLVSCFQACASFVPKKDGSLINRKSITRSALTVGEALHSDARRRGYMSFAIVCNTVMSLYGKCGAVVEAEHVFAAMPDRNEVSYNVMLSAYNEQGQGETALQLYTQMELEGLSPDEGTFVLNLQACTLLMEREETLYEHLKFHKIQPLHLGHVLHAEVQMRGFSSDNFVNSTLVSMYGKCGAILEAEYVFLGAVNRTLVIWNAMISSYVIQGQALRALHLYRQMHEEGPTPDELTYSTAVLACATLVERPSNPLLQTMSLDVGHALHSDAKRRGFTADAYVGSSLMSLYGRHGCLTEVEDVFDKIFQPDTASWNAMLSAYLEWGMARESLQLFVQMSEKNATFDEQTLMIALQACVGITRKEIALQRGGQLIEKMPLKIAHALQKQLKNEGYAGNATMGSVIISVLSKLGAIADAELVFYQIGSYNVNIWTAMISAYVANGDGLKGFHLYMQMREHGVIPNHITITCIVQACIKMGSPEACERIHFDIVSSRYDHILSVSATLLYAYGTQMSMPDMQALFDNLPVSDIISWNACIGGYVGSGFSVTSLQAHELLKCAGFKPDKLTLTLVLAACSHSGLVPDGLEYIISLNHDFGILPDSKHHAAILDLLGRAGDLRHAKEVFEKMPPKPDHDTFFSLLGACRAHGDQELAEQIFAITTTEELTQATAYVLMSNVYAEVII